MKTRKVLKTELAAAQFALRECQSDRTAVHETRAAAERERDTKAAEATQERQAASNAERERGEALASAEAARAEALANRTLLETAIGQRDEWARTAETNARGRTEAQEALRLETALRKATETELADVSRTLQHSLEQTREAVALAGDAAQECASAQEDARVLAERLHQAEDALIVVHRELEASTEALAAEQRKAAEVRQTLADCRQSRSIIQTQRDTILTAAADQGIMIPVPGGPTPKLDTGPKAGEVRVGGVNVPLMTCSQMGEHVGHPWWPRMDEPMNPNELRWCDGRNADGSVPYDPTRTAAQVVAADRENPVRAWFAAENDVHAAEDDALVEGGDAEAAWAEQLQAAAAARDRALIDLREARRKLDTERRENDAEQAELARQRDALQDWRDTALQALYFAGVAQGEAFKVRAALEEDLARVRKELDEVSQFAEMKHGSVTQAILEDIGGADQRPLIEHWQGVAERLERDLSSTRADCKADHDRLHERATEAERKLHVAEAGYSELHSRLVVMMEERDNLLVENEALNREREDALSALRQVKAERDELVPLRQIAHIRDAQAMIREADQRRDNLARERDAAIAERDEARGWIGAVNEALGDRRGGAPFVDDAVRWVVHALHDAEAERGRLVESLQEVKAERDALRPLALLADPIDAKMHIDQAEARMNRAEAEFANLTRERDNAREMAEAQGRRARDFMARCDELEQENADLERQRTEARAEVERARSLAMDSMMIDGAVENALGKLVGVLGVEAYESPADVIDSAVDALKDARREAGRLKLVLDIIDERKASEPVEVERRAVGGPQQDAHGN